MLYFCLVIFNALLISDFECDCNCDCLSNPNQPNWLQAVFCLHATSGYKRRLVTSGVFVRCGMRLQSASGYKRCLVTNVAAPGYNRRVVTSGVLVACGFWLQVVSGYKNIKDI